MRSDQKVFVLARDASFGPGITSAVVAELLWLGGAGWLDVVGTFSGSTAFIVVNCQVEHMNYRDPSANNSLISQGFPHPDFVGGIASAGTYKFSAPPGLVLFTTPMMTGGDTITALSMRAVRLDSYETGH